MNQWCNTATACSSRAFSRLLIVPMLIVFIGVGACGGGAGGDSAAAANPPVASNTSATSTLSSETMIHASTQRSYLKYTPAGLPAAAVPLVIVLHGGSEDAVTASSTRRATFVWRDIADREKFLLVYPDGLANNWRDCRSDAAFRTTADDVAFIDALITRLAAERAIDLTRVYVTGASNGGMMSFRLAQELPSRFAGVGAVIANLPVDPQGSCRPANVPVVVVIMDGTLDPLVPFAGGIVALNPQQGTVRSAIDTRDYWVGVNGCAAPPLTEFLPDLDATDGITVTRQLYRNCSSGKSVVFFQLDGGGHSMPSRQYGEGGRQGRDIEGAEEIWRVLRDARR